MGAKLHGVYVISDASNVASVVIYDNPSAASGTVLAKLSIPASTTAPQFITFNHPITASTGLYADVSGTGANYIVYFSPGA
jgi:hypothetical protein